MNEYRTYKITDAAGVGKFLAVVQGTNAGEVKKPTANNDAKFIGITQEDQLTQNKSVLLKRAGFSFAVAGGAIAVGDAVRIHDTDGRLESCQTDYAAAAGTAKLVYCVGFAETAAGADGDIFELRIHPHLVKTAAS